MSRRLPHTPNSHIKNALRALSMRCRERAQALKAAARTCARCGAKASVAKGREVKVEVHHKRQPNWQRVYDVIREEVLQVPGAYEVLCVPCHDRETASQRLGRKVLDN